MNFKIDEFFAFVSIDPKNGSEGIVGMKTQDGWMPLVGGDMKQLDALKIIAADISKKSGRTIHLLKFTNREDLGKV